LHESSDSLYAAGNRKKHLKLILVASGGNKVSDECGAAQWERMRKASDAWGHHPEEDYGKKDNA